MIIEFSAFISVFGEKRNRTQHVVALLKITAQILSASLKGVDDNSFCHRANSDIPHALLHVYLIAY